jgi:hypothetical protein
MAGRYADTLRYQSEIPKENRSRGDDVRIAASLGALGRKEEAKAAAEKVLSDMPGFSIEEYVSDPVWSDAERQRLNETMRVAGFPVCAGPERLATIPPGRRLPECSSKPTG